MHLRILKGKPAYSAFRHAALLNRVQAAMAPR
jgi:hypothetical protein